MCTIVLTGFFCGRCKGCWDVLIVWGCRKSPEAQKMVGIIRFRGIGPLSVGRLFRCSPIPRPLLKDLHERVL